MKTLTLAFRDASIGAKLSLSTFTLVGGLFLLFILWIGYSGARSAEQQAVREVTEKTRMLADTVDIVDSNLRDEVAHFAKVFRANFKGEFQVDASRTTDIGGKPVPVLKNGDNVINLNFSELDRFTDLSGVYATVFVRSGDDFIRVATSHKKENGERAVGTMLDRAHPAYQAITGGNSYAGAASLFGGQYMTQYDPIKSADGKLIGILYVGVNFTESMKTLAAGIKAMKLGESGVFYALDAKEGKDYGKFLIHPANEGENVLARQDHTGRQYVKAMLEQKQGNFHYLEPAAGGGAPRERVLAFTHIKNWNMVIAGDAYLDEITAASRQQRNQYAMIGLFMVAAIAALLYPLIRKLVSQPLGQAVKVAETVASGDLTSRIEIRSKDETGRLMLAMQHMNESLAQIVGQVRAGTTTIAQSSAQISEGNMDLSSRTEQQAASLEETASSMEELTSTVRQNADNARRAHALAQAASQIATQGGDVVAQVVDTMGSINDSAKRIADIISVIDGIAFQTNILALNAAVEAARAGEQGRGFAVVASEVRNLAQRSATAAHEIKALISDSVQKVEDGSKLVDQAGATMHEIVSSIRNVTDIMDDISTASAEQSAGIEQVNLAITQMDEVTQQNAALVEEAAAASQGMQDQADKLAQVVSVFRLEDTALTNTRVETSAFSSDLVGRKAGLARTPGHGRPSLNGATSGKLLPAA